MNVHVTGPLKIRFDCETFMAVANNDGSISVEADIESFSDSDGIVLALARKLGADHVRRILDIELRHQDDYKVKPPKPKKRTEPTPEELVKCIIPHSKLVETKIPEACMKHYRTSLKSGRTVHIGKHKSLGHFVLDTPPDEFPEVLWSEK